jgi:hypothetical protein
MNKKFTKAKREIKTVQEMKLNVRGENTLNLRQSLSVCSLLHDTSLSEALRACGTVHRIFLIPSPNLRLGLHDTQQGFSATVKKKGSHRFISSPFLSLLLPCVLLVSCQLSGGLNCRIL